MKSNLLFKPLYALFLLAVVNSCIQDVDFNQIEDLALFPVMESSLIYFQEPATSFLDEDGVEVQTRQDTLRIEIFTDEFFEEDLLKAEFLFEGTNTINRAYEAQIDFLDDDNTIQHTLTLAINASPDNSPVLVEQIEVFEDDSLENLKNTTQLAFNLILFDSDDGSIIDQNTPGDLRFRSMATFYFQIEPF